MNTDNSNVLVDVRAKVQYDIVNLSGSINIPLSDMMRDPTKIKELASEK